MSRPLAALTVVAAFAGGALAPSIGQMVGIAGAQNANTPLPPVYAQLSEPASPTKGSTSADKVKLSTQKAMLKAVVGASPTEKEILSMLSSYAIIANHRDKQQGLAIQALSRQLSAVDKRLADTQVATMALVTGDAVSIGGLNAGINALKAGGATTNDLLTRPCKLTSTGGGGFTYEDGTIAGRVCEMSGSANALYNAVLRDINEGTTLKGAIIATYDCIIRGIGCD